MVFVHTATLPSIEYSRPYRVAVRTPQDIFIFIMALQPIHVIIVTNSRQATHTLSGTYFQAHIHHIFYKGKYITQAHYQ